MNLWWGWVMLAFAIIVFLAGHYTYCGLFDVDAPMLQAKVQSGAEKQ